MQRSGIEYDDEDEDEDEKASRNPTRDMALARRASEGEQSWRWLAVLPRLRVGLVCESHPSVIGH